MAGAKDFHIGYLCIVLHGHLPYVRHPEAEEFLEEDWLYEAITESYIPLIQTFQKLAEQNVKFKITFSLSPTLIGMLKDELLQARYLRHIERLIDLGHKEVERTRWEPHFQKLALMYLNLFCQARDTFLRYNRDLTLAFKELEEKGVLELITCSATHGYLPLGAVCPSSVRAQIRVGIKYFQEVFGRRPQGMWLPECGYTPGLDNFLKEEGIRYFFLDTHGILHGTPRPKYGVYAPVYCRGTGVAAFGRDVETSRQVWSSIEGYPGDYDYRDFYRDIGFDLDFDYVKPYINPDGTRIPTGIKYYRITGKSEYKEIYLPERAREKAAIHAGHFMFCRHLQAEYLYNALKRKPVIVAPYDAELFGHWWFEGPSWLEFLIKKLYYDQDKIKLISCSEYLKENPKNQVITPCQSSWGWKGYHEVWLQGCNDWIYPHLHMASQRMEELVEIYPHSQGVLRRALNQALRELLLAYSSDWPFIMACRTHVEYAVRRIKEHLLNFTKLYEDLKCAAVDEEFLRILEARNNIFPNIDYRDHTLEPSYILGAVKTK